jgi:O-antigen ligase
MLMTAAIVMTLTRAAWLSVLVGVGVLVLHALRRRPVLAVGLATLLTCSVLVGPALIDGVSDDPRLHHDENAVGRVETSMLLVQQFVRQPIFGWGPMTLSYFPATSGYTEWVPHNTPLAVLVALGAVGFGLYLAPAVLAIIRKSRLTSGASDRPFLVAGVAAYIVNALAIDMQYFSYPHVLFWLCLGCLAAEAEGGVA